MTLEEAQAWIGRYRDSVQRARTTPAKRRPYVHDYFVGLCEELGVAREPDPFEPAALLAMCVLAEPEEVSVQDRHLASSLARVVRAALPRRGHGWRRADEFAVASPLGWGPGRVPARITPPPWPLWWQDRADRVLGEFITQQVSWAVERLRGPLGRRGRRVIGFASWYAQHPAIEIGWIDELHRFYLRKGGTSCECWKDVRGADQRDLKGNARAAHRACMKNHGLPMWRPRQPMNKARQPRRGTDTQDTEARNRYTLWRFTQRAVNGFVSEKEGRATFKFHYGYFPNGMLFRYCAQDAGMDIGSLARWYCGSCRDRVSAPCTEGRLRRLGLERCGFSNGTEAHCELVKPWLYLPRSNTFRQAWFFECQSRACSRAAHPGEGGGHCFEASGEARPAGFSSKLTLDDFKDPGSLAVELRAGGDRFSSFVTEGDPVLSRLLAAWTPGDTRVTTKLKEAMRDRLNRIIQGEVIPADARQGLRLRPETWDLLRVPDDELRKGERMLLNRLLIEDRFPEGIVARKRKCPRCGWSSPKVVDRPIAAIVGQTGPAASQPFMFVDVAPAFRGQFYRLLSGQLGNNWVRGACALLGSAGPAVSPQTVLDRIVELAGFHATTTGAGEQAEEGDAEAGEDPAGLARGAVSTMELYLAEAAREDLDRLPEVELAVRLTPLANYLEIAYVLGR